MAPTLKFRLRGVEVKVHGVRRDVPPGMESISYEIFVDTDETDQRLELLHLNVRRYGTVFNTVAPGTALFGTLAQGDDRMIAMQVVATAAFLICGSGYFAAGPGWRSALSADPDPDALQFGAGQVVGVLIKVSVMLLVVKLVNASKGRYEHG